MNKKKEYSTETPHRAVWSTVCIYCRIGGKTANGRTDEHTEPYAAYVETVCQSSYITPVMRTFGKKKIVSFFGSVVNTTTVPMN